MYDNWRAASGQIKSSGDKCRIEPFSVTNIMQRHSEHAWRFNLKAAICLRHASKCI